jgi:hypothetical protein
MANFCITGVLPFERHTPFLWNNIYFGPRLLSQAVSEYTQAYLECSQNCQARCPLWRWVPLQTGWADILLAGRT